MKHFLWGLLTGGLTGIAASLLKDKNGQRIGQPIADNLLAATKEAGKLKESLHHARQAVVQLSATLPAAKKSLNEIDGELNNFQARSRNKLAAIQRQGKQLTGKIKAETKKN